MEKLSRREAGATFLPLKGAVVALFVTSALLNLLGLNGSLFMLQVYDRVLASGSVPTLLALCALAGVLYGFQALFDALRARMLLRLGEAFDARFSKTVLRAIARAPLSARIPGDGLQPMRDLDTARGFLSGPGLGAFFDLPWVPLYLAICFLFHFWLGVTALVGALVMFVITLSSDLAVRGPSKTAMEKGQDRSALTEAARRNSESIRAMGLEDTVYDRWQSSNSAYLAANRKSGDFGSAMNGVSRSVRQALQSAILAVGAWLVIQQEASAGVMIAASIMMGRAMSPVDTAIGHWKHFVAARQSWGRLKKLPPSFEKKVDVLTLPPPSQALQINTLTVMPPGAQIPSLVDVTFRIEAGQALGVIGASGCGKTSLARSLTGVWSSVRGDVRFDGAAIDQWKPSELGKHIGYLPQSADLFEGTISENVARFQRNAPGESVVAAAKAAGAHDFITALPKGYQTSIGIDGAGLSGGQRQRIGLARALFGDPFLLVLDEPNANLDAAGEAAVIEAVRHQRERNGIAVVIAHRPSALGSVDLILVLDNGRVKAFGPKKQVLSSVLSKPVAQKAVHGARMLNPLRVVANASETNVPPAPQPKQPENADD
ncbi:type I secretion system permease/ATPase [Roseibium algae]|uniref:Type I secretion system permease/ATPase n=1 Tax=Roseibium algae TaxID=3123038 RepID=A0ABU8TFX0_9HYPH